MPKLINQYQDQLLEAGCDEAGRGCYAGPVFAAAVVLPKNFYHPLLNDSKQLTEAQRELLAPIIKASAITWAIAKQSAAEIDASNILKASIKCMHLALDQLKPKAKFIAIDGNRFYTYKKYRIKPSLRAMGNMPILPRPVSWPKLRGMSG